MIYQISIFQSQGSHLFLLTFINTDMEQKEQQSKISQERKSMVGSGDRSGKIRTYNFPQARVTDHRIGLTLYKLEDIMQGHIDMLLDPLITYYQAEALKGK